MIIHLSEMISLQNGKLSKGKACKTIIIPYLDGGVHGLISSLSCFLLCFVLISW